MFEYHIRKNFLHYQDDQFCYFKTLDSQNRHHRKSCPSRLGNDPFLSNYGLKIEPKMLKTKVWVFNSPEVWFSKASMRPGTFDQ